MFNRIIQLLQKLVDLDQESNTHDLEVLCELREANKHLRQIEHEQDMQTELLKEIAADLSVPAAGPAASLVLKLGTEVQQ